MGTPTEVLDAAYERLARWGFDDPDGYVNHGPMVCEALAALDRPADVDAWSRLERGTPPATPVAPRPHFDWGSALGDLARAGEWIGRFERAIADDGWSPVLRAWLPRLLPGLGAALFHGLIRCAHATRAITAADTPARRAELARSLGYWAACWSPGHEPREQPARRTDDVPAAVVAFAADAARRYLAKPNIIHLHGITAAMAVSILVDHVDQETAVAALAQLDGDVAGLIGGTTPAASVTEPAVDDERLVEAAIASGEAHAVKLVEACRRAGAVTGDPVFRAAAERACRRGLRALERSARAQGT